MSIPGAILIHANLFRADLFVANLSGAILNSANLSGAILDNANLSGAAGAYQVRSWSRKRTLPNLVAAPGAGQTGRGRPMSAPQFR